MKRKFGYNNSSNAASRSRRSRQARDNARRTYDNCPRVDRDRQGFSGEFDLKRPRRLSDNAPKELEQLQLRCMTKTPHRRVRKRSCSNAAKQPSSSPSSVLDNTKDPIRAIVKQTIHVERFSKNPNSLVRTHLSRKRSRPRPSHANGVTSEIKRSRRQSSPKEETNSANTGADERLSS